MLCHSPVTVYICCPVQESILNHNEWERIDVDGADGADGAGHLLGRCADGAGGGADMSLLTLLTKFRSVILARTKAS